MNEVVPQVPRRYNVNATTHTIRSSCVRKHRVQEDLGAKVDPNYGGSDTNSQVLQIMVHSTVQFNDSLRAESDKHLSTHACRWLWCRE